MSTTAASDTGSTDGRSPEEIRDRYNEIGPITGALQLGLQGTGDQIVVGIGSRRGSASATCGWRSARPCPAPGSGPAT